MPYLRFGVTVISLFLVARLLKGVTLPGADTKAVPVTMPYQRGQFWVRRFQRQAAALCTALAPLCAPAAAANFVCRALHMLESIGWIAAHGSCSPICDSICWAGRRFWLRTAVLPRSGRLRHPPEGGTHNFAWSLRRGRV